MLLKHFAAITLCLLILLSLITVSGRTFSNSQQFHDSLKIFYPKSQKEIVFDKSKLAPQNVRLIFNEFFKQYSGIRDALAYNDASGAERYAVQLLDKMRSEALEINKDNKDVRWELLDQNYENIKKKISSQGSIADQRFAFSEISEYIQTFIKQYGLYDKTIFLLQCDKDSRYGKGEWLASDTVFVKNPYLGIVNDTVCAKVNQIWKF
ncbi:MAG: DUF3347 domain-containing protein [bacterium]